MIDFEAEQCTNVCIKLIIGEEYSKAIFLFLCFTNVVLPKLGEGGKKIKIKTGTHGKKMYAS